VDVARKAARKKATPDKGTVGVDPIAGRLATGTDREKLQLRLLTLASRALILREGEEQNAVVEALMDALAAINPRDGFEGILASQMVAVHETAMECLRRASFPNQTFEARDVNLKHAAKLLQLYVRQVEALDKHRGKGQQKITVEHVTVEAGGQAIVGSVETPSPAPARPKRVAPPALTDDRASRAMNAARLDPGRAKSGAGRPSKSRG
jgi:hypothetical protein